MDKIKPQEQLNILRKHKKNCNSKYAMKVILDVRQTWGYLKDYKLLIDENYKLKDTEKNVALLENFIFYIEDYLLKDSSIIPPLFWKSLDYELVEFVIRNVYFGIQMLSYLLSIFEPTYYIMSLKYKLDTRNKVYMPTTVLKAILSNELQNEILEKKIYDSDGLLYYEMPFKKAVRIIQMILSFLDKKGNLCENYKLVYLLMQFFKITKLYFF